MTKPRVLATTEPLPADEEGKVEVKDANSLLQEAARLEGKELPVLLKDGKKGKVKNIRKEIRIIGDDEDVPASVETSIHFATQEEQHGTAILQKDLQITDVYETASPRLRQDSLMSTPNQSGPAQVPPAPPASTQPVQAENYEWAAKALLEEKMKSLPEDAQREIKKLDYKTAMERIDFLNKYAPKPAGNQPITPVPTNSTLNNAPTLPRGVRVETDGKGRPTRYYDSKISIMEGIKWQ
jgi:hypothetical protein